MLQTIVTKTCCHCKEIKPLSEFYKNRSTEDGYSGYCKVCHRKSVAKYCASEKGRVGQCKCAAKYRASEKGKAAICSYMKTESFFVSSKKASRKFNQSEKGKKAQRDYCIKNREKRQAKNAVSREVRNSRIPPAKAFKCPCGAQAEHYHHHSYAPEYWLDVVALCHTCHIHLHYRPIVIGQLMAEEGSS